MAEKKGVGHAYNVDFLNVVFAASSLFLFLSVIWMVWDDYDRDWKSTQRRFAQLEYQVTQAQLQQATRGVDRGKMQQLQAQQQESAKKVAANQQKVDELEAKVKDLDNRLGSARRRSIRRRRPRTTRTATTSKRRGMRARCPMPRPKAGTWPRRSAASAI